MRGKSGERGEEVGYETKRVEDQKIRQKLSKVESRKFAPPAKKPRKATGDGEGKSGVYGAFE